MTMTLEDQKKAARAAAFKQRKVAFDTQAPGACGLLSSVLAGSWMRCVSLVQKKDVLRCICYYYFSFNCTQLTLACACFSQREREREQCL